MTTSWTEGLTPLHDITSHLLPTKTKFCLSFRVAWTSYLTQYHMYSQCCYTWWLNIHIDTPLCHLSSDILQVLDNFTLKQHVNVPTHSRGHTLDLGVSDHKVVSMELQYLCLHIKSKCQINFRNLKNIDHGSLSLDLQQISSARFSSARDSVDFYKTLRGFLNLHDPMKTQSVTFSAPWFTDKWKQLAVHSSSVWKLLGSLFKKWPIENSKCPMPSTLE